MRIGYISTWFPTACGIANFTHDLATHFSNNTKPSSDFGVIATSYATGNKYDKRVVFDINVHKQKTFDEASDFINQSTYDVIALQHEFDIFDNDPFGHENLINLCDSIKKPLVLTVHGLFTPNKCGSTFEVKKIIAQKLCESASKVVVMTDQAVKNLVDYAGIERSKIACIPHGSHPFPIKSNLSALRKKYGLPQKSLIFGTSGFFWKGKGIDQQIKAFSEFATNRPDVCLWLCGSPHPQMDKNRTDFKSLQNLIAKSGCSEQILVTEKFFSTAELEEVFSLIDVYINTNLWHDQGDCSGTLAYALGAGKSIIAYDFMHAREALTDQMGKLVPVGNIQALTNAMTQMKEDPKFRALCAKNALEYGEKIHWPNIVSLYKNLYLSI
ncbi:MAG: glycosyltransferase [bacterium]